MIFWLSAGLIKSSPSTIFCSSWSLTWLEPVSCLRGDFSSIIVHDLLFYLAVQLRCGFTKLFNKTSFEDQRSETTYSTEQLSLLNGWSSLPRKAKTFFFEST